MRVWFPFQKQEFLDGYFLKAMTNQIKLIPLHAAGGHVRKAGVAMQAGPEWNTKCNWENQN